MANDRYGCRPFDGCRIFYWSSTGTACDRDEAVRAVVEVHSGKHWISNNIMKEDNQVPWGMLDYTLRMMECSFENGKRKAKDELLEFLGAEKRK